VYGSWFAVLTLAFGPGMLHALDADHIMAVSWLAALISMIFGAVLHG
jgi:hypothetical protein